MKEQQGSSVGAGSESKESKESKSPEGTTVLGREPPPAQKPEPSLGEFLKVQTTIATALEHWSPDTQRRMLGSVATVLGISRQGSTGQVRRMPLDQQQQRSNQQSGGNQNNGGRRG